MDTFSRGISWKRDSILSRVEIGTPTLPTSPSDILSSESKPICVGKSNATDKPITPFLRRYLNLLLDSFADVNPAYCLIVQSLDEYILG